MMNWSWRIDQGGSVKKVKVRARIVDDATGAEIRNLGEENGTVPSQNIRVNWRLFTPHHILFMACE